MPASTLDPISASLRASLGKSTQNCDNGSLDTQLIGGTKKALLANIEFEPAGGYQTTVLDKLKTKYVFIKSNTETPQPSKPEDVGSDEELKLSDRELYPIEAVQLGWTKCDWTVGAGMINMGNTCYLNSTLQALFHVPALVNWLMGDKEHNLECQDPGGCIICAMRKTLQESQQRNTTSIRPLPIFNKLRLVCRNLIPGRQEDAHEFLRYLVEAMEKSYLCRFKNHTDFDAKIKETTPLNQILGGYLRSAVRCLKCGKVSTTFQHFQDLMLDIRKAQTLEEALEGYFSREKLDDDSYHCQSCERKVPATKQFSVERAPMVLCIQLKRFSVSNNKITKHIHFRQRLDLTRYARHRPSVPLIYRLVALVTHMGPTVNCGHYTAVAQAPTGSYYQFDDNMVRVIPHQTVFNTNAYIMLYELESPPFKTTTAANNSICNQNGNATTKTNLNNGIGMTSDVVYGPELPPERKLNGHLTNGKTSPMKNGENHQQRQSHPKNETASPKHEARKKKNETTVAVVETTTAVQKIVPYDIDEDDSSGDNSDNTSAPSAEQIVTTKTGEWQVTTNNLQPCKTVDVNGKTPIAVVKELHKTSHNGYAAPMVTWNGNRSQLDKDVNNERREERKRTYGEANTEQGCNNNNNSNGKAKRQRMNGYPEHKSNPGYNAFQEYQNKPKWNSCKSFYNGGRHRRQFNNHRNNNNRYKQQRFRS